MSISPPNNTTNGTTEEEPGIVDSVLNIQLTKVPGVLVGFYATETALTMLMVLLLMYFGRFLPRDFAKLGRILNCFGILLKLLPKLIILMHYVIFILILVVVG